MKYFRYPDCNVTTYCLGYIVCKGAFTKMATSRNFEDMSDKFDAVYSLYS